MDTSQTNKVSLRKLTGHTKEINCCAFSKKYFVTCSGDKTVRIYNTIGFKELKYSPLFAHTFGVTYVTFDKNEKYLATASSDGSAKLWNLDDQSAKVCAVFEHSSVSVVQVCQFSNDNTLFVTGSADGSIAIWNLENYKQISKIEGHPDGTVTSAAFTPCCDYLVTGSSMGDIRVWTLKFANMQCVMQTQAHDEGEAGTGVNSICFSPTFHLTDSPDVFSNYLMASCGHDNKTKLWIFVKEKVSQYKAKCLEPFTELIGHTGVVSFCCFSNNGSKLATGSIDKTVVIWSPMTGEQLLVLRGHSSFVYGVAFSRDDTYLASVEHNKITFIWKLNESGAKLEEPDIMNDVINTSPVVEQTAPALPSVAMTPSSVTVAPTEVKRKLTKKDVLEWLTKTMKMSQYHEQFSVNEIDGEELFELTGEMLQNDLGIKPLGHRNKILRGIEELRREMESGGLVTGEAVPEVKENEFKPVFPVPSIEKISEVKQKLENATPKEYLCPITQEIMENPVIASDGFTYEKDAIQEWFVKGSGLSPMTNQAFKSNVLTPNQAIKTLIQDYISDNPVLNK